MSAPETVKTGADRDRLLTRRQLLERPGWTAGLLKFLPPPNETCPNPHNVRGPVVKLYRESTILGVEQRESFQQAMQAAERRKAGAQAALETKRAKMIAAIESAPDPGLPTLDRAELERRALGLAVINYLLAELEPYRQSLLSTCKRSDVEARGAAIDQKILDAISRAQPWLSDECQRLKRNSSCDANMRPSLR